MAGPRAPEELRRPRGSRVSPARREGRLGRPIGASPLSIIGGITAPALDSETRVADIREVAGDVVAAPAVR